VNDDIKNFIASYESMIATYAAKVKPDSAKLAEARACLGKMAKLGESGAEFGPFMTKITELDLMGEMSAALTALAMEGLEAQRESGEMKTPSASDAALGYHKAFESMQGREKKPATCAVYERVFEIERESASAIEFLRRALEEGLLVKMSTVAIAEEAKPLIAQAGEVSLPAMAHHHEKMIEMAQSATSSLEVEYESQRLYELNRAELTLDQMLCNDLVYLLGGAVSGYLMSPTEENRQRVENSYIFVADFTGLDMDRLFALPRVRDVVEKILVKSINQGSGGKKYTVESFIDEQKQVIAHCMQGKQAIAGPQSRSTAVIWGRACSFGDAFSFLRNPARPEQFQR